MSAQQTTMSARDTAARTEILARIRRATADITDKDPETDSPIQWEYGRGIEMDDVVSTFVQKVIDYSATVVRVAPPDVPQAVVEGLRATGARMSAVVPAGLDADWIYAMRAAGLEARVDEPALSKEVLNDTEAVVTAAACGIADTGTIVLTHIADQGRRAITLVPDRHVCVVRASQVVSDVPEATQIVKPAVKEGHPLTWISGGSATSDIELSRVDGVHGPRKLYVIVVDDI
ncbi:LutC/YkgG family protein [Acidipropionibacterium jensenii]|uniref:Lactate utilization protein C n=1 Tax=Acidipropionibacterium jensenii TaxID=1749 RepID=A0A3T0S4M3_9ACTN|nr:lactate utilization protein C [Acidipropionibacterium jensenii]AZZ40302.1 lactate utilization protein C [Acidipropionibacterium jensenii]AZZ41324.1 lactate utilization protein C [Acidipropionibacterium jensenii]MDN5976840.1 lactate utilization protein C [Acidipropionibacterium jensenii]MDN5995697.1 lactate utilization protein C [Acidipropionibacterium jensenii]MDN6427689.1 lactate utilization protein C [Acidipropionibacterium jensenii]